MDILEILKQDYQNFPKDQTYSLYAENVFFKDPMTQFNGVERYQKMIGFIKTWFKNPQLDLHAIERSGNTITTQWTLHWTTPLPWNPRISIPGWSELKLNSEGLICSHVDYWNCSRLDVIRQHIVSLQSLK